jgi:hypothetical protein
LYPATTFILTFTGICSYKFFTNKLNYDNNNDNNSDDDGDYKFETFSDDESSDQKLSQNHDNNLNQEPSNNYNQLSIHKFIPDDNNKSEIFYCEESFRDADSEIILDNSEDSDNDEHTEIVLEKSDEIEKQISFESSNNSDLEVHGYDRHCIIF